MEIPGADVSLTDADEGGGHEPPRAGSERMGWSEGPDEMHFAIDVACSGSRWNLHVSGELNAAGASAVIDIAEVLAIRQAPAVDLDLSEVTVIDAAGWGAAAYAQQVLTASGADCRVISPPPPIVHPAHSGSHRTQHAA